MQTEQRRIATYSCNILTNANKVGRLKTAEFKGTQYWQVNLGAFNVANEHGVWYHLTEYLKSMFDPGGDIHRRLERGYIRGEWEHPQRLPGMNLQAYMARLRKILMSNVSHQICKIELVEAKDHEGRPIILVVGWVTPSGKSYDGMRSMLMNAEENVAFSLRSFSQPTMLNGIVGKGIRSIVTWDNVNEPGVRMSNKYDTPSLESIDSEHCFDFTEELLMASDSVADESLFDLENGELITSTMVRDSLGWDQVQLITPRSATNWQ